MEEEITKLKATEVVVILEVPRWAKAALLRSQFANGISVREDARKEINAIFIILRIPKSTRTAVVVVVTLNGKMDHIRINHKNGRILKDNPNHMAKEAKDISNNL